MLALHPASASPRHIAVPGFVAALIVAGVAIPWTAWPFIVLVAPYLMFVTLGTIRISSKTDDLRVRRRIAPSLMAMHIGSGVGFLRGIPDAIRTMVSRRTVAPNATGKFREDRQPTAVRDLT